jgi:hypothetical protein
VGDEAIAVSAKRHAKAALAALVEVMGNPEASPSARISAASAVLTWAFGRKGGGESEGETERPAELRIRWLKPGEEDEAELPTLR